MKVDSGGRRRCDGGVMARAGWEEGLSAEGVAATWMGKTGCGGSGVGVVGGWWVVGPAGRRSVHKRREWWVGWVGQRTWKQRPPWGTPNAVPLYPRPTSRRRLHSHRLAFTANTAPLAFCPRCLPSPCLPRPAHRPSRCSLLPTQRRGARHRRMHGGALLAWREHRDREGGRRTRT